MMAKTGFFILVAVFVKFGYCTYAVIWVSGGVQLYK